jgi:multimeric flavodoxin WrbA/putative sterol carrier protein
MKLKPTTILFITSFIPVIVFKVVARMGEATLAQAKAATAVGLILAGIQYLLSKKVLKHNTYLEKAFLGFLAVGTGWVYLTPPQFSSLFVDHSTALLYLVLFFTTFLPQLLGYDPFTYAIAKQWYPPAVWNTPQFKTINFHITYFWSGIFFLAFLSSWLGNGKPLFSIVLPLLLILLIALPFVKMYPNYYLKRQFASGPLDLSAFPNTARELISRMPLSFDREAGQSLKADIQFDLSGEGGGKMFLAMADGTCRFGEGEIPSPDLTIHAPGEVWLKMARGEMDRPRALMDGLFRVEGDMNLLMKMGTLFHPPQKREEELLIKEGRSDMIGEKKGIKILAIQGSPRPKASNTEVLLKEFLKGAQAEGAEAETIYLKEKDIHPCIGCYTCWTKTPGVCVFKDDMPELLNKVKNCDILVYATPLYNYNMTALMKAFQERLLPLLDPHLVKKDGIYHHPQRFNVHRKMVLISTCGFPEVSHFDALRHVLRIMERNGEVPLVGEILVPGAEAVLKQEYMRERAEATLKAVHRAGIEVVRDGRVSKKTEEKIQKAVISADEMAEMANLWWDGLIEGVTQAKAQEAGKRIEDMRLLLRGMAATFKGKAAGDLKATIQFEVSGKQPGQWCLSIENGKCTYREGKTDTPTLTIQTPSEVWLAVANKEMDGQQAFMEGKYTAQGDMGLLMRLKSLFGSSQT